MLPTVSQMSAAVESDLAGELEAIEFECEQQLDSGADDRWLTLLRDCECVHRALVLSRPADVRRAMTENLLGSVRARFAELTADEE